MGYMGQDGKELAGDVAFLGSEAASYVTEHNLAVDGGLANWWLLNAPVQQRLVSTTEIREYESGGRYLGPWCHSHERPR